MKEDLDLGFLINTLEGVSLILLGSIVTAVLDEEGRKETFTTFRGAFRNALSTVQELEQPMSREEQLSKLLNLKTIKKEFPLYTNIVQMLTDLGKTKTNAEVCDVLIGFIKFLKPYCEGELHE